MTPMLMLIIGALFLRSAGAIVRSRQHHLLRSAGWLACAGGAWLAAGALGAWAPLWPAVAIGAAGALVHCTMRHVARADTRSPLWLGAAGDAAVVIAAGAMSIPSFGVVELIVATALIATVGLALDALASGLHFQAQVRGAEWSPALRASAVVRGSIPACGWGFCMMGVGALALAAAHVPMTVSEPWHWLTMRSLPHTGLSQAQPGQRVALAGGAVGWLSQPSPNESIGPAAVMFHGAHELGSRQGAAAVLRRALLDAGFIVLSVDHPGFGASPPPKNVHGLDDWDPLPVAESAVDELRRHSGVEHIIAVGHSMGCSEVLRLLAADTEIDAAVLFGAGLADTTTITPYWHQRFHEDRGIEQRLPMAHVRAIVQRYYDNAALAQALPDSHPPILFVRFGHEFDNVGEGRDALYEMLPGPKEVRDVPLGTHYLNSGQFRGLVGVDVRAVRGTARLFREIRSALEDGGEVLP